MNKELDNLLHPLYRKLYTTKHRETGQTYVGTLLLMRDDRNDGYGDYQPVKWYVCLIHLNDNSDYYRIRWGTDSFQQKLNGIFTKPEPVDDSVEGMEYWFEKWKYITKTFLDQNPTRQLWDDSQHKGGQVGYQKAYKQSPLMFDYMDPVFSPTYDRLKGEKEASDKLKRYMKDWLDDDSHKTELKDLAESVTKSISSDILKM